MRVKHPPPPAPHDGEALPATVLSHAGRMTWHLDDYDLDAFADVAAGFGQDRYTYVVTPNVDHLIRLHEDVAFRALYADAGFVLLDSRFLSHVLRVTKGVHLPVCAGSDLVARLFADVIHPDDPLVLIGGSIEQVRELTARHGLTRLAYHNPPMGFIHDPDAVEDCLRFIEAHSPFRFCLLAIGSPQQEIIARHLQQRGHARGLALCIGASVNFITGTQKRAPRWMQRSGLEWVYRLLQEPNRLARRYLVRGPRVFGLLPRTDIVLRRRPVIDGRPEPAEPAA
ncbi:WecB/TagA/CpsF family glycosyltransferase [Luteimonas terrae]|uniref:Exopolysaccharide biosynthesis WecB/TagA/CpsF family protein n=1 Tax=Luteimonas terrae TaxID=1530191 RepID=A0ABU1XY79_9GAMM|nr:WecB/TagA/CpsF family glycosyltransferase [Luteimonas terrae]MDR7193735.1 exopolysaccharide biosynthesis WecB/TagA/CpsF family protein [Luteimonas terrae]